jgi:hypothetical protein
MPSNDLSKPTFAFGRSLALASIVNALIVVAKEKSPAVMDGMKKVTGHHWTTHSAIVLALFLVLGFILPKPGDGKATVGGLIRTVIGGAIIGSLIIVAFYLIAG